MAAVVEAVVNGLVAFGLLWGGYRLGRRSGCRVGPGAASTSADPWALVCSCGHSAGKHERSGQCGSLTEIVHRGHGNSYVRNEWVQCACTNYDGPDPDTVRLMRGA